MLLCCTDCGRLKGGYFPVDMGPLPKSSPIYYFDVPLDILEFNETQELPLLINPTVENPWDFLEFDYTTGNITAKYDVNLNAYSQKGENTVGILHLDQREALSGCYKRSFGRICKVVEDYLDGPIANVELLDNLRLADENGLLEWCILFNGQTLNPFADLNNRHPDVWHFLADSFRY